MITPATASGAAATLSCADWAIADDDMTDGLFDVPSPLVKGSRLRARFTNSGR